MANAATIQAKINRGYGKVAAKLGTSYQFFRPAPLGQSAGFWDMPNGVWDNGGTFEDAAVPLVKQWSDTASFDSGAVWDGVTAVPTPIGGYIKNGPTWDDEGRQWQGPDQRTTALNVSLNAKDWNYVKASDYGKATWYAAFDPTYVLVGDYFVGARGIFFVAGLDPIVSILAVECNRTINVYRPQEQNIVGRGVYGGNTDANQTLMLAAWPASILQGAGRQELTEGHLPGDKREPGQAVLLPFYPGVVIRTGDIITDDMQRRMVVASAELTSAGWRMTVMQAVS